VNPPRKLLALAVFVTAVAIAPWLGATPIEPTAKQLIQELQRPPATFVPARVGWDTAQERVPNFNLTFEQYGPQATARAVRASLRAALTPDPLAMAALLFCAFALRWMRMRAKQQPKEPPSAIPAGELVFPKAA
jgi:hypothetical protein